MMSRLYKTEARSADYFEPMMNTVQGTFDVNMHAEPPRYERDGLTIARATFDKTFHGPLSASGHVEFISVRSGDAAAYVAIERIEGTLDGRRGGFVVTHRAQASSSQDKTLSIDVVPGASWGELVGLTGSIDIEIREGQHYYTFEYSFD